MLVISNPLSCNLKEHLSQNPDFKLEARIQISYKICYAVNSLLLLSIPPPILDPSHIFMSKSGNPQILLPFFSQYSLSYKNYYIELINRNQKPSFECGFIPPFYEELLDKSDIIVYLTCNPSLT